MYCPVLEEIYKILFLETFAYSLQGFPASPS